MRGHGERGVAADEAVAARTPSETPRGSMSIWITVLPRSSAPLSVAK